MNKWATDTENGWGNRRQSNWECSIYVSMKHRNVIESEMSVSDVSFRCSFHCSLQHINSEQRASTKINSMNCFDDIIFHAQTIQTIQSCAFPSKQKINEVSLRIRFFWKSSNKYCNFNSYHVFTYCQQLAHSHMHDENRFDLSLAQSRQHSNHWRRQIGIGRMLITCNFLFVSTFDISMNTSLLARDDFSFLFLYSKLVSNCIGCQFLCRRERTGRIDCKKSFGIERCILL